MEHVQTATAIISKEQLLHHWQGHRSLTRRVIEAFPEKELFEYSIGGMRPFFIMAMEVTDLASAGIKGLATNEWDAYLPHDTGEGLPKTKKNSLPYGMLPLAASIPTGNSLPKSVLLKKLWHLAVIPVQCLVL
jgi:hypothetical protein